MWSERARPTSIDEIVGQHTLVEDVKSWLVQGWPSALLLVGPYGTGKTSSARVIAREMLGDEFNQLNYVEINGSDDRGIDFIRNDLKTLLRTKPVGVERKVVLIDEADGLTPAAQDAAKQLMETYASNALVIMTGNELEKIKPAIRSRCRTYTFKPVGNIEGAARLWDVLSLIGVDEDIKLGWSDDLPNLIEIMNGDLRSCLNLLESLPRNSESLSERIRDISAKNMEDLAGLATKGEWMKIRRNLHDLLDAGVPLRSVMSTFYRDIKRKFNASITDTTLFDIMCAYGDVMLNIYTWPQGDHAFCDYMVASMRKEVRNNERN
jgi:replication factor C small subunit|tara:strand:- start:15576 stop:16541 length:966 start_codon:yes stop_codon:yes gene_type:complete